MPPPPKRPEVVPFFKLLAGGGMLSDGALSAAFCAFCAFCVSLLFEGGSRTRCARWEQEPVDDGAIRVAQRPSLRASASHASVFTEFLDKPRLAMSRLSPAINILH